MKEEESNHVTVTDESNCYNINARGTKATNYAAPVA